jgi:hypothetical protein
VKGPACGGRKASCLACVLRSNSLLSEAAGGWCVHDVAALLLLLLLPLLLLRSTSTRCRAAWWVQATSWAAACLWARRRITSLATCL